MSLQVLQRLFEHADLRPDSLALREADPCGPQRTLTYARLAQSVTSVAGRIEAALPDGGVVILCHANRIEVMLGFFGCLHAGATVFPVHPNLTETELITAATQTGARAVIGHRSVVDVLGGIGIQAVESTLTTNENHSVTATPRGDDRASHRSRTSERSDSPALLLQSSGTTGTPKIVLRSGPSLDAVARNVAEAVGLSANDRVLGLTPACHSYGVENIMLAPIWAGAAVELCENLDTARVMQRLAEGGITVFPGVPTMFEMLSHLGEGRIAFPELRCAYSAGASLPPSVIDAFLGRFDVRLGQLYGMTEIGSVTFNDPSDSDHDPQSVGLPMNGVRIRIVDSAVHGVDQELPSGVEGEVAVSAPSMLEGYVRTPSDPSPARHVDGTGAGGIDGNVPLLETTDVRRDGYLLTGDLGRLDRKGRLTITGRTKLIVDVGGMKVNLLEVEAVLNEHPAVKACAVNAVPVSETVSRLKAFVVPACAELRPGREELRAFLRLRLSAHKVPRTFEIRDSLPRSATGKLLRHLL